MTKEELKDLLEESDDISGVHITGPRVMFYHRLSDDDFWQMISNLVREYYFDVAEVRDSRRPPGKLRPASIVLTCPYIH
jgi:hypothetical protein